MLQKIFSALILLSLSWPLVAHEFWLEPINFEIEVNDKLRAHEKVGQDFKGNKYSYLASSYKSLNLTIGGETREVKSRLGDLPAVGELVTNEGLAILAAETTPTNLTYDSWETFSNFLKKEKLDWVFAEHKKRNLPEKNFVESYRRYAKSVVKVGNGKGIDRELGLSFEWVLETNPYTSRGIPIKARLLWQGSAYANSHVSVFNRIGDQLIRTSLKTDDQGRISIPRHNGGKFLINAVQMLEAKNNSDSEEDVVWDSRWASITYELKPS